MAGIDLLAPAAQPGLTVTLVNEPYVVKADDTWEAVAFWYILEGSPISYPGNVQVYAVKISSAADVSTWVNITSQPYNDDPAKWPSWSKADIALFAAAHTAAGCTGGG
ncbi:MAG: hypothetical protein FWD63_04450 [Propionibacteriaceae bacterium]|nr:hypothetical protein [Propionibacteriaceae bacterium]